MYFNYLDPNDPKAKPSHKALFLLESFAEKGEADSPAGLTALLVGRAYADVFDERVAWQMRFESLVGFALTLTAFMGKNAAIVDGSVSSAGAIWVTDPNSLPDVELRVDGDYAMVASLQRAGLVRLFERGRVFRDPGSVPANCTECLYWTEGRCSQFDLPVSDPNTSGCLDGVTRAAVNGAARMEEVVLAEIPPQRLKSPRSGGAMV